MRIPTLLNLNWPEVNLRVAEFESDLNGGGFVCPEYLLPAEKIKSSIHVLFHVLIWERTIQK